MDQRLEHIYKMIPEGKIIADIGTDHGNLVLALAERGKGERLIATDISAKSLSKLEQQIINHPQAGKIETVVTDGLKDLENKGIQVVVIAGMGGVLMGRILDDAVNLKQLNYLVLSPNTGSEKLRPKLSQLGFRIVGEDFVEEEGIFYPIILATWGEEYFTGFGECQFGKVMPAHPNAAFIRFIKKEKTRREKLLQEMKALPHAAYRVRELEEELEEIGKVERRIETARNL